jgi:hypothetical protein
MSQYPQGIFQTLAWLVKQVKLLLWKTKDSYKVYTALLTQSGGMTLRQCLEMEEVI